MPGIPTSLSGVQQQMLTTLAAGQRTVNLLSAAGATTTAVSDILAAAGSVVNFVNTANAALTKLNTPMNDPIGSSFSTGQPYGGTFITSPTITQLTPVNFSQVLNSSTSTLSKLSLAQQSALAAKVVDIQSKVITAGVNQIVGLANDADLAAAMAVMFSDIQSNLKLAFSIDLTDSSSIIPYIPNIITDAALTIAILPLTLQPDMIALSSFIANVAQAFPNIIGIAGVAASIWVDGLGVSVDSGGNPISGVPTDIVNTIYNDITTAANILTPSHPAVTIVDYSYQQNQFNLVVALAIDNGLSATISTLMETSLVTPATFQVIKNRLSSVAARGDATTLHTLFTILGSSAIPNATALVNLLLNSLKPSDQIDTTIAPVITASGITLTTTTPHITTTAALSHISSMLTLIGTTIHDICIQNTCDSILCSQNLLNVQTIKTANRSIITTLLDQSTVDMAYMF